MHHISSQRTVHDDEQRIDQAIVTLLLEDETQLWSIDELARDIGNRVEVTDSIERLYGVGLIHRVQHVVFLTRVARRGGRADEVREAICRRVRVSPVRSASARGR